WWLGRDVGIQQDRAVRPPSSPKYSVPGSGSSSRSSSDSSSGSSSFSSSGSSSGLGSSFGSGTIAWVLRTGSSPQARRGPSQQCRGRGALGYTAPPPEG